MLCADYFQRLDPLHGKVAWSAVWSTLLAALPVLVLFWLLVPRRWLASKAGAVAALTAIVIAVAVYGMPFPLAIWSFLSGVAFGILPVGLTIFSAMLLYNITVETGQFNIVRRSVAGLSGDARIQAVLIGFSFGAFLEGAAGAGTPVAICGAILVGLGFKPFLAAVLCLIANTSPVAFGGLGTPILVLSGVTGIDPRAISTMAGHQLPILSFIIPIWMVKCMCTWRQTLEVWPALVVSGGSFALFQFAFATIHNYLPALVLYPMTDIGGGIFSLIVTAVFLKLWKPAGEWHFDKPSRTVSIPGEGPPTTERPLTAANVAVAWMPFVLMSIALMFTGIVRQKETPVKPGAGPVEIFDGFSTNYQIPIPTLHEGCHRDGRLHAHRVEEAATWPFAATDPLSAALLVSIASQRAPKPESALFNFAWLTAPGSGVLIACILSMVLLRMNRSQINRVFRRTFVQMKVPIPTIACMLGLSYVTRYSGMDATLGYAFAYTGLFYPFFAAILGWLGVFLTGTDAGSNALFGSLQKITATQVYNASSGVFSNLSLEQAQVLICTANSTGGVMGKMIDAQSICVATAATHQMGREADIFKAVIWHSVVLASIVGLLTLLQAYLFPLTMMVPILTHQ